jgi:hypothetical protein
MRLFFKIIIPLLLLITLASCGPNLLYIKQTEAFEKGMSKAEFNEIYGTKKEYMTMRCDLLNGQTAEIIYFDISMGYGRSDYLVTFIDGKLFYWGLLYEYSRSTDHLINEISRCYRNN